MLFSFLTLLTSKGWTRMLEPDCVVLPAMDVVINVGKVSV